MVELLSINPNYLIYQSKGLVAGGNITVRICGPPDFVMGDAQPMIEVGGGLYRITVDFSKEGLYLAQFFEDGEPTTSQTYRVYKERVSEPIKPKANFRL